ncbi:MAG TPA: ABC-type transport auxiliary lipoprotein family protein [Methylophilus sp.]|nr:ABC-type transport auxiliary lipoprotein family protein [Methylophilus sp.]
MITKNYLRNGLMLVLACSMSACLKSNPPMKSERYSLPEIQASASKDKSASQSLVLNKIQLADYLDSDRIVVQLDDITLHPARDHLWVDNLSQELSRGLRTRLSSRLPDTAVVDPLPGTPLNTNSLQITVDQFHGQMQGYAVFSGQWQLLSADRKPLQNQSFKFTTPLSESGYPALVRALGNNLDLLSEQIAAQIQRAP